MEEDISDIRQLLEPRAKAEPSADFMARTMHKIAFGEGRKNRPNMRLWAAACITVLCVLSIAAAVVVSNSQRMKEAEQAVTTTVIQPQDADLTYDNTPLGTILDDIAGRYGCAVRIERPEAAAIRLHITIESGTTLDEIAEALNSFDGISAEANNNTLTIK